jgi:hypothetical protein
MANVCRGDVTYPLPTFSFVWRARCVLIVARRVRLRGASARLGLALYEVGAKLGC